jgi:outer membrane protein assembly factor BamB
MQSVAGHRLENETGREAGAKVVRSAARNAPFGRSPQMGRSLMIGRGLTGLSLALLLAGCGSWNPFSKAPPDAPLALVEFKSSMNPKVAWTYSIGKAGLAAFAPVVAGNSVYVAAADGSLARLDSASGKAQWRINVGSPLGAGVGSDGENVAVVSSKGLLMTFDGSGKLRWKEQLPSEVLSPPAVGDGMVVVRSGDNRISAYDAQTGTRRWSSLRTIPPLVLHGSPGIVIDSGIVYVAQPGGKLLALSGINGGARWESIVADPKGTTELERVADVVGRPVLVGHEICATAYQGRLSCFDAGNGVVRWGKDWSSYTGPAVDERFVFAVDTKSVISGFAREAGQSVWRNEKLLYRQLSTPISLGRAVVVGDYKGFLHFLGREDGAFLARLSTDGSPMVGSPVLAGDRAIFQTQGGTVLAVATE